LPVPADYDIRHRSKNENMQNGDDAHKATNGGIKADSNGNQSTRMEGIISRTAYKFFWVRFVATSALQQFHRVASEGKAPDTHAKNARKRD
jgi:hypothetical protein